MDGEINVLMVLANQDFRDEEYTIPRQILEDGGAVVKVAASQPEDCMGVGGTFISPDFTFEEIDANDYEAIIFVGGIGVEQYFSDEGAIKLARDFSISGKYVCAICAAPAILARAGLLNGRKVTAAPNVKSELDNVGAKYTGESVTVDGKIITGSGPEASADFGEKISGFLA